MSGPKTESSSLRNFDFATTAIVCSKLDEALGENKYRLRAKRNLSAAIALGAMKQESGIISGLANLAFSIKLVSDQGHRYLMKAIDSAITHHCANLARPKQSIGLSHWSTYDAVEGLSGLIGYLLTNGADTQMRDTLSLAVEALLDFAQRSAGSSVSEGSFDWLYLRSPDHSINCGVAHGVPGVLSALSLTKLLCPDYKSDRLAETIDQLANWLIGSRLKGETQIVWPYSVFPDEIKNVPSFNGWCYGAPGVLRSIWLAGSALPETPYRAFAENNISDAVLGPPGSSIAGPSSNLCHGTAGQLLIALRFFNETGRGDLRRAIPILFDRLVSEAREETRFLFEDREVHAEAYDLTGLLYGCSGIALSVLAACGDAEPTWDRMLLIA